MNATLVATLAGSITALCWGFGDWLSAKGAKKFEPIQFNFGVSYVNLMLALGLLVFSRVTMPAPGQLLAILIASVLIPTAYIIFVKALANGPVGIIVPLGNSYPLVTVALTIAILSQAFGAAQVGAMAGIVLGAMLLAYQKNHQRIPLRELHKDTALAVLAAVIWGFGFFSLNTVAGDVSWQTTTVIIEIAMFVFALAALGSKYRSGTLAVIKKTLPDKIVLWCGFAGALGFISLFVGSDYAKSSVIVVVLSSCSTLVAAALGAVFERERLGALKRMGAVLVVGGIIVLNLA
jgi:drug/metabolite transporter (DMT)-like permease